MNTDIENELHRVALRNSSITVLGCYTKYNPTIKEHKV